MHSKTFNTIFRETDPGNRRGGALRNPKHEDVRVLFQLQVGFTVVIDGEVSDAYRFKYAPVIDYPDDLEPGVIPAGYSASVKLHGSTRDEDTMLSAALFGRVILL